MSKKYAILFFACTSSILGCSLALAQFGASLNVQSANESINPRSPVWAKQGYLQVPFNAGAKNLPRNFKGHSTKQVYASPFSTAVPVKRKYETTAQYESRVKKLSSSGTLFGKVQKSSPLAFSVAPAWVDYDADHQDMKVHFAFRGAEGGTLGAVTEFGASASRRYVATNGFGAQVEVSESSGSAFGFTVTNWKDFDFVPIAANNSYSVKKRLTLEMMVPLNSAPRVEKSVKALFVGYIVAPGKKNSLADFTQATFDSPYSRSFWRNYVYIRLKSVLLYDSKTGDIVARMNPKTEAQAAQITSPAPTEQ